VLSEVDLSSVSGRQARYAELLGQMNFVLEWITNMHEESPNSIEAKELVEDFESIVIPFREMHEKLMDERLSWDYESLPAILKDADEVRAEALRIVHTVAFQQSLNDGRATTE